MNSSDTDAAASQSTFTTIDEKDSVTTLGARLDGHADDREVANNHYNGFIYSIRLDSQAIAVNTIKGSETTTCGTGCNTCPSVLGSCLWNCDEDEYFDGTSCQNCPTC